MSTTTQVYDLIIVGGGPAGLCAALYAARKLLRTLLISEDIGGQMIWTYDLDNYLGFSQIQAADLIAKFEEHVTKYGLEKRVGRRVTAMQLNSKVKILNTSEGETYASKTVILATGQKHRQLNVPGEKELTGRGVSYCSTCDAPLFAGMDVAVAGGGNSALEAVIDLLKIAKTVHIISATPLTGDPILQKQALSSPNVSFYSPYKIVEISGNTSVDGVVIESLEGGAQKRLEVQGVMVEIGLLPNSEVIIDSLRTNRFGEIVIDEKCQTGIPGVFACGDVTTVPFKQVIVAAGEGAKAALAAYEYLITGQPSD